MCYYHLTRPHLNLQTMTNMILSIVLLMTSLAYDVKSDDNPGTTPHLETMFIGRCWDYQLVKYRNLGQENAVDCEFLWKTFFKAFSFKAPCALDPKNYEEFMDMATQNLPFNKIMFWSGTYVIAHEYAENSVRYVTLEDTLVGYLANSLVWCGSGMDPSGMNMSRCPSWTDCPMEASESFWGAASATFARSAKGIVTLMLDGSREGKPSYSRQSFFAKYELLNLNQVTKVLIIVVHSIRGEIKETCNNGSIVELKEDIQSHDLPFECVDDPPAVVHILCADDPWARECHFAQSLMTRQQHEQLEQYPPYLINDKPNRFGN